jgi:diguanylate cyclase (GGDEF)-like protein
MHGRETGNRAFLGLRPEAWPARWLLIALPAAHFVSIYLFYRLNLPALWVVNSFLLVALIRSRLAAWPVLLYLTTFADASVWFVLGPDPSHLASIVGDTLAPLLIAVGLRRFTDTTSWFRSLRWSALFLCFTVLSMTVVLLVMFAIWSVFPDDTPQTLSKLIRMVRTGSLGVILGTPFLLFWTEGELRNRITRAQVTETLVLSGCLAILSYIAFNYPYPLLFLAFPFLMFMTLRGELVGATVGTIVVASFGAWYTARGIGPFSQASQDPGQRLLFAQLYFFAAIFTTLPLAVILALRRLAAEDLAREYEISSAALKNMAQGLCMSDAEGRLITCNGRYADLYSLPPSLTRPGSALSEIVEYQIASAVREEIPDRYVEKMVAAATSTNEREELELPDGRVYEIHRKPLPTGGWVSTHEDVTDSRRAAKHIAHLASHDPLTDLPNRGYFHEELQRSSAHAERGHGFALHCLDLDHFKEVNDTMGHAAGDELLTQVSGRLRALVSDGDLVARLGGDEFAILQFPLEAQDEAARLSGRIVDALAKPYTLRGGEASIGVSIGTALAPIHTVNPAELLQKADLALYKARAHGRGTQRFFEPEMDNAVRARRVLESELRAAVQKGEFEIFFQPIVDVARNAITSFEALIRWHHPIRGIVPPAEFIPIAEETGLIVPIGDWVLRQACREATKWPNDIKVAVNLSAVQFKNRKILDTVTSALASSGLDPRRLELEMTESVLMNQSRSIARVLEQFSALGISLALDDFGTGYSSLSYLRSFPFNKIKIDRSFVRDLSNADSRAIVHATVQLSSSLGMTTTAEGVETAEQRAALEAEGCTNVQGYHIGRPIPGRDVAAMLEKASHADARTVAGKTAGRSAAAA